MRAPRRYETAGDSTVVCYGVRCAPYMITAHQTRYEIKLAPLGTIATHACVNKRLMYLSDATWQEKDNDAPQDTRNPSPLLKLSVTTRHQLFNPPEHLRPRSTNATPCDKRPCAPRPRCRHRRRPYTVCHLQTQQTA